MEYDKMSLILKVEFPVPSLVENNELAIKVEPMLKTMQVEEQHPWMKIENVLFGVEDLNFPIESLTFSMDEDRQVSFIEKHSFATSHVRIDAKHGEMTLLVGEEKMKLNLHQSIPLTDEEMRACKKIESSFSLMKKQAPMILQEDIVEGYKFEANELAFELTLHNTEVEKLIFTRNEDEEGVLAMMDEGPKRRSRTSPMSIVEF